MSSSPDQLANKGLIDAHLNWRDKPWTAALPKSGSSRVMKQSVCTLSTAPDRTRLHESSCSQRMAEAVLDDGGESVESDLPEPLRGAGLFIT